MLRKIKHSLSSLACLLWVLNASAAAQVKSVPFPTNTQPVSITVIFTADVAQMDGAAVPAAGSLAVPPPSIYFKEGGRRVYLTADASFASQSTRKEIELTNFKTIDLPSHPVDLVNGSTDDGGVAVAPVPPGGRRAYFITWESMLLNTQSPPAPVITVAKVGSSADNPPSFSARVGPNNREFFLAPTGISARALLDKFKSNPGRVRIVYDFDPNDPASGVANNQLVLSSGRLSGLNAAGAPDDLNPAIIIVDAGGELPHRDTDYSASIQFPAVDLRGFELPGFKIPADAEFVTADLDIVVADLKLTPAPTDRAESEFFFESTFTSIVDAKTRKRGNVGLFGLHVKPTLPVLTHNVYKRDQSPWWTALRPLFDADVDTQHIDDSEAPNRVVFGADFELGRDAGLNGADNFLQQSIWINGVHYDSDRDFKLQTLYWHTEYLPHFRNWAQTREQRLRHLRFPGGKQQADMSLKFPLVSSYSVQPSIGYQLGGTINRDNRDTGIPTDTISRFFFKYSSSVELKRLITFSLEDTYYFLENAPRRRNRNYLETRLDFNTGGLFNVNLGSLQSALTFKFQRGELPPRFKPVNAFSMGVRLYR
jgi:hypothetical protein